MVLPNWDTCDCGLDSGKCTSILAPDMKVQLLIVLRNRFSPAGSRGGPPWTRRTPLAAIRCSGSLVPSLKKSPANWLTSRSGMPAGAGEPVAGMAAWVLVRVSAWGWGAGRLYFSRSLYLAPLCM